MADLVANTGAMAFGNSWKNDIDRNLNPASTGFINSGYSAEAPGNTWRGIGADWFNAENVALEDYKRNEQAANNQLARDLYLFQEQKNFTREQMDWEKEMSSTSYQRAVEDMKKAGINPVMAINQGGASTPSAPSSGASSSRGGYSARGTGADTAQIFGSILALVGGIYGAAAKNAASILNSSTAANARIEAAKLYSRR